MSAIKYGLERVMREIPSEILHMAFLRKSSFFGIETTLEQQITDLVIKKIVLRDTNIIGGITVTISLDKCDITYYEKNMTNHNMVIKVPYRVTNKKKILEPLSLVGNVTNDSGYNVSNNPILNGLSNKFYHDASIGSKFVTSNLELIAPNTILVYEESDMITNGYLKVVVENNENLTNISTRSYLNFGELCVLAAKQFIYNKLVIDLDKGALYGGHEIGKIGDIISGYESATEEYNTFIKEKWQKTLFMNDKVAMSDYLKTIVSPT